MQIGGIVLCGGQSRRMGRSKADLPFGPELMLQRVVRIMSESLAPIVVVAARTQDLPELKPETLVVRDTDDWLGPLSGLSSGLAAIKGAADAAYATSCDVPFLRREFVEAVATRLGDHDLVMPFDGDFHHPLASVYRTSVLPVLESLLAGGQRRPVALLDACRATTIEVDELRIADPDLQSLRNLNTPGEYLAALRDAGFEAPEV